MECPGTVISGEPCGRILRECKRCGHRGCNRATDLQCSAQAFFSGKCYGCGVMGFFTKVKDPEEDRARQDS